MRLVTKHQHAVQNDQCQMIYFECKMIRRLMPALEDAEVIEKPITQKRMSS